MELVLNLLEYFLGFTVIFLTCMDTQYIFIRHKAKKLPFTQVVVVLSAVVFLLVVFCMGFVDKQWN